jgi:hypothetical protein
MPYTEVTMILKGETVMKRLPLAIVVFVLLLSSGLAQDKFPTGTFAGGSFTISLGADKVHTVSTEGRVVVKGTYVVEKDQITFTDQEGEFACPGQPGKYKWAFDGKSLSFTKVEDNCDGRVQGLTAQPWVKK